MWQKTKDFVSNLKRHKIMVLIILVLGFLCYRMFVSNYIIVNPIIKKDNYQDPIDLHNQLAACLQNSDEQAAAIHANNVAATSDFK